MKERGHCTSGVCPDATTNGALVSISVDNNHRLLQLKRALPWEVLFEIMRRHWQRAGKNTDGRPGLPWDVSLYVPQYMPEPQQSASSLPSHKGHKALEKEIYGNGGVGT